MKQFTKVSLSEVQENLIPQDLMRDKVVLIGATAESLKDLFYTPYSSNVLTDPARTNGGCNNSC